MDDACDGKGPLVITIANSTDITSPGHPSYYPNNKNCSWRIVGLESKRIHLSIKGQVEKKYV